MSDCEQKNCGKRKNAQVSEEKQRLREEKLAELIECLEKVIKRSNDVNFQARFLEMTGENNITSGIVKLRERFSARFHHLKGKGKSNQLCSSSETGLNPKTIAEIESINVNVFSSSIGIKRLSAECSLDKDLDSISEFLEKHF
jgi:hypothetical protein